VGDVVEEYQFTLSIENECPYMCEFCYIQGSLAEKPIPTIFTNVQDKGLLLREVKIALLAMHMHTQTHGFKHNIGWDQQKWVHRLIGALNKAVPTEVADVPIQQIFENNKEAIKKALTDSKWELLKPILAKFNTLNFQNTTAQFKFNCGEINDALVYDHLTDNSKFLIELFSSDAMKNDGAVLLFRTKSANFDNLKKLTPGDNIRVSVTVLPAMFVKGPPDYVVRLQEANELLKLGYQISLNMDPIILTTDTVKTYKKIIDNIKIHFDYKSLRFHRITIGMLRFGSKNLDNNIRKRHVDLYGHAQRNMTKVKGDEKYRYDRAERIRIYKALVEYINAEMPGIEVELSTEPVDVWTDVGLTP
jgi:DNA repair photolyase